MITLTQLLTVAHLLGLALAVGSATAKLVLLIQCKKDPAFAQNFLSVARPITRLIIVGMVLLTLSGIGWIIEGYPFTALFIVKIVMVVSIWILGPIIDNVVEPKFKRLAPGTGEPASPPFKQALQRYLALELIATGLFYAIIIIWILA